MENVGLIITGGAGFIGLNFINLFSHRDKFYTVLSIDKMGYATLYNKKQYDSITKEKKIQQINCNINELIEKYPFKQQCLDPVKKWIILDFASESHVDNSIKSPNAIWAENSMIPANLIAWIGGVNNILKYVHISTDEVYGSLPLEVKGQRDKYFNLNSKIIPTNPYAASKAAQDAYLMSLHGTFGLSLKIIRFTNQFGLWQHPEKMIPNSLLKIFKGEPITIYGTGENYRQWSEVNGTCHYINKLIENILNNKDDCELEVNICDTENLISNIKLVDTIESIFSNDQRLNMFPIKRIHVEDRLGHDMMYAVNPSIMVKQYFTYSFNYLLTETIIHYLERYKNGEFTNKY